VEVEDVLLAACAGALASCPALNGRFAGDAIETWEEIHLAFSVAVGQSLAWPVLRSPGRLPIDALSALRRELARRVRAGEAKADDEKGSTFSVALLGELGIESAYEVIRPPQAAILAIGTPVRRAVVRGHGVEADWVVSLGLSCDRRIAEEPAAARFLAELRRRVEQPMLLLGD
ncbi:MAG: 2-oxo acid dehydrogenase subunit E2, partial [Alphaproteobacteria bacterium]